MVFERAILQQLGVQTTVTGAVDVLEECAVERRADGRTRFIEVNRDVRAERDVRKADEGPEQ